MRLREVLGVDLAHDRLHVVQLRQDSPRPVATHWATREVPPGAEPAEIASVLRRALAEGGFTATAAVFGLPAGRGFIQCRAGDVEDLRGFSEFDYVTDSWPTGDGRAVWGIAARSDVTRVLEIAAGASLTPVAVDLRAAGLLTAMGLLGPDSRDETVLGIVLGEATITIALVERLGVLSVQDRPRDPAATGALDHWEQTMGAVEKMWRLARMDHPDLTPTQARVLAGEEDASIAETLQLRLGVHVAVIGPGQGPVAAAGSQPLPATECVAAVGLALEGLETDDRPPARRPAQQRWFNFLRPTVAQAPARSFSWKRVALAAAIVLAILLVGGISYTMYRGRQLRQRQAQYDRVAPEVNRQKQLRRQWRTLRQWVAPAREGSRSAYRELLDEITRLYPTTKTAHIHSLSIGPDETGAGTVVRLDGQAQNTEMLYAFLSRLNDSPMFERAGLGAVTDTAGDAAFPKRFSITFHLKGGR